MTGNLEEARLKAFWNSRYSSFALSESGWLGGGEKLNRLIYACKMQALRQSLDALGHVHDGEFSVLDAGCGQGFFPRFYNEAFPRASYVGIDISERAIDHLRGSGLKGEFHVAEISKWSHPDGKKFDVVQSFEVMDMILDDQMFTKAVGNLAGQLAPTGSLLMTAALLDATFDRGDYIRYRSRKMWLDTLRSFDLHVVSSRPMYYWLPAGGPANRYWRFALTKAGVRTLYVLDRAAMAMRVPHVPSSGPDCRMRLLTVRRVRS